jgi:hypothetical protein
LQIEMLRVDTDRGESREHAACCAADRRGQQAL